jgi:hypothetical protein
MGRLALLLLSLAAAACTRADPEYCADSDGCASGFTCILPAHECRVATGVTPDLAVVADLRPPPPDTAPQCTTDGQCAALSPTAPICLGGTCRPCTRNFQCPNSACNDDGSCHDPSAVLHVSDTLQLCGSPPLPYCSVQDAVAALSPGKDVILIAPSTNGGYTNKGAAINVSQSMRFVGQRKDAAAAPVLLLFPLSIGNNSGSIAVGIDDLEISPIHSGFAVGVFCVQKDLMDPVAFTLRWSVVDHAAGVGVGVQSCSPVTMISNQIVHNGVLGQGGTIIGTDDLTLLNNVIADNAGVYAGSAGISLSGTLSKTTIAFNTVEDNACPKPPCNIKCNGQGVPMSYTIAFGQGTVDPACLLRRSVVPTDYPAGQMNVTVAPDFMNEAQGDYHLLDDAANRMSLLFMDADPPVRYDLDDNPRPGSGGVSFGAYQLP